MTKSEYLKAVNGWGIRDDLVATFRRTYRQDPPQLLQRIISHSDKPCFFEDGSHVLSLDEILNADEDLGVTFATKGMIPVVDCCDGNYIIYDCDNKTWAIYSIIDDVLFRRRETLAELL